ncbi:MAG TPA: hypothetical protein VE954_06260 [Oligoflexus sp.]|uniref:hypothetical protein n=1 Tax=Oligoflexus sp. TaxID=1971216 RepID=UPI002D27DA5E|nr:hypothetical protein [Oligoflexus sp.]HYX32698.1 hypothetical protein [Oligoflexus sp.]
MLIRSSLVGIFLTATLASGANCESSADATSDAPEPLPAPVIVPTPIPTATPYPTPEPEPPLPKRADLKLLPAQSACAGGYRIEIEPSGAMRFSFDELNSEASLGKYRAACRLAGKVMIPKGYRLDPAIGMSAVVKGSLYGPIDNVTGRLKLTLGRYTGRDFELAEYTETEGLPESKTQNVKIELNTQLPELPASCTDMESWSVSLFVESTINGRAVSRIEELKLDSLNLLPIDCQP